MIAATGHTTGRPGGGRPVLGVLLVLVAVLLYSFGTHEASTTAKLVYICLSAVSITIGMDLLTSKPRNL